MKHFIINIIINDENRDVKTTSKTSERGRYVFWNRRY